MEREGVEPAPAAWSIHDVENGFSHPVPRVAWAMSSFRIPQDQIDAFCRRWRVEELAVFGSALREDFRPDSDVDVLVTFEDEAPWSTYDLVTMQEELQAIFARPVDLVEKEGLRNPFRRHAILRSQQVLYAA